MEFGTISFILIFMPLIVLISICIKDIKIYEELSVNILDDVKIITEEQNEPHFNKFNVYQIGLGEYLPYVGYDNKNDSGFIKRKIDAYSQDEVYEFDRYFTRFEFEYNALEEDIVLELPLTYYKGYIGTIDGKKLDVYSGKYTNNVTIDTEYGNHVYVIHYESTLIAKISFVISFVFIIICMIYYILRYKKNKSS